MIGRKELIKHVDIEKIRIYLDDALKPFLNFSITARTAEELIQQYSTKPDSLDPEILAIVADPDIYRGLFILSQFVHASIPQLSIKKVDRLKRLKGKRGNRKRNFE